MYVLNLRIRYSHNHYSEKLVVTGVEKMHVDKMAITSAAGSVV